MVQMTLLKQTVMIVKAAATAAKECHVFTLGAAMLGWHGVPTGFVPSHVHSGTGRGACPQACANIASGFLMSTF